MSICRRKSFRHDLIAHGGDLFASTLDAIQDRVPAAEDQFVLPIAAHGGRELVAQQRQAVGGAALVNDVAGEQLHTKPLEAMALRVTLLTGDALRSLNLLSMHRKQPDVSLSA